MGKKRRKPYMSKPDPELREVKYILLGVVIVFLGYFVLFPVLSAPSMFLLPEAYAEDQNIIMLGDVNRPRQGGTGTTCPTITGPSSATDAGTSTIRHWRQSDATGCEVTTWTFDLDSTTHVLIPSYFNDFITGLSFIHDPTGVSTMGSACRLYEVSEQGVDPRLNITAAYEVVDGRNQNIVGSYNNCDTGGTAPEWLSSGTSNYLDSMALNSTFFSYGIQTLSDNRQVASDSTHNANTFMKLRFTNPTVLTNTMWMMQEHPKFPSSDITGGFFGIDDTTFTMDSNTLDDTEIGQVVVIKEFNKTTDSLDGSSIRITGGLVSQTSAADQWVRIEVKDGSYGTQTLNSFPEDEYDTYQDGGSLGVIHIQPTTSIETFDISFTPNWSNSTNDIVTVFIGVDDNSTAGSTIANITSVEWDSIIKYNFEDINQLNFYETSVELSSNSEIRVGANDYDAGFINMTNVTASGFSPSTLPTPSSPTDGFANATSTTTIDLTWNHNLLNVTDFEISRNGTKLTDTNNIDLNYTDTGLTEETPYGYTVCAINGDVKESTCTTMEAVTQATPIPDPVSDFDATAFETGVFLNWTKPSSTPELDTYHIERSFSLNGTWQFREIFPGSGGGSTICGFSGSSGPNDVWQMSSTGSTNYGACQTWINLPTELINNTKVHIDWEGEILGFQTGTYTIKTGYANQAVFGNPFTSLPVLDSSDIVIGTQGQPTLDTGLNVIGTPVTKSIVVTTGFPREISTYEPSAGEYAADTSNPYTALVIQVEDDITDGGAPALRIFSVNVTDATTDETLMFWNFTETNNAGLDNNIVFNYDYGTFDVDISNTEPDDATIFNTFEPVVSVNREQGWDEQGSITETSKSIDYGPQTNEIRFRDDGKTVIISHPVAGFGNPILKQYNLTQAWNLTTAVFYKDEPLNEINNILDGTLSAFDVKPDGTLLWATDTVSDEIFEFEMTTPWDLSTLDYTGGNSFFCRMTGEDAVCDKSSADNIFTLRFTTDGRFIIALDQTGALGQTEDKIYKYAMSTPYDIETLFERPQEYDLTSDANGGDSWNNMALSTNGTLLYLVSQEGGTCPQSDIVQRFELNNPFNITSANKIGFGRNICSNIDSPTGLNFKPDGTIMYVTGRDVSGGALDHTAQFALLDVSEPNSYYDYDVELNTDYKYQIFSENTNGNSTVTQSNSVLTNDKPAQVTGLTAVRNTPTQIDLQWDTIPDTSGQGDPSTGVLLQEYRIFRSENGGAFELVGVNERQSPPAIFFNDTSVNATFFYSYNVEACNELGCGNSSSSFFVATSPPKPQNLTATADIADVLLEWIGNSTTDDDYRIERGNATVVGSWTLGTSIPDEYDVSYNIGAGIFLSSDGQYLFLPDVLSDTVNRHTMSTPFEITTATSTQNSTDLTSTLGSKVSQITDIHFKRDGKTMFVLDNTNTDIYEYSLGTAWDLSTLAYNAEFTGLPSGMQGFWFTEDGLRVFLVRSTTDQVYKYNLTSAWDISTITFAQVVSSGASTGPFDIMVRPDGKFLGILDIGAGLNDSIDGYNMTTAFDLTTLVGAGGMNVGQSGAYAPEPRSMFIPPDGRAAYVDQVTPDDKAFQFNLNSTLLDNFLLGEFEIIVPSLVDSNVEFLSDDFTKYPDNATADLTWIPEVTGFDSADDVVGVNATLDKIMFTTSTSSGSNILFDLNALLGKNLTDSSGAGDFNMTWTSDLTQLDGDCSNLCVTGAMFVNLIDRDATQGGTQTGITTGYFYQGLNPSFEDDIALYVMEDQAPSLDEFNGNCNNHGPNPNPETLFHQITKIGNDINYKVGIDTTYGECSVSHTTVKTLDDIQYLTLRRTGTGSSSNDHGFRFDDFSISTNGTLVTLYRDKDVELGTAYTYRVTALNSTIPSEPSETASVLTNDFPEIVENAQAEFNIPTQVDIQWDELDFDSGAGNPTTGLNLTKYQIFRQNVTAATPYELAGEVFASSPPPNFFNDTSATFPSVFNYQISACNALGCSANSTSSQTLVTQVPDPVVNMSAIAVNNTVSLDWDDSTFAINYTITRGILNASHIIIAQGVTTSDYIDTTVSTNVNYTYSAWAVNNNGNGTTGFSNSVITNDLPTAPQNLVGAMGIVIPDLEDVFLDWEHPLDNGTGDPSTGVDIIHYQVERKQGVGAFSFLANTSNAVPEYEDETVISGANYTYKVRGINALGFSPFSNTFSIITTPLTPPQAPTDLTANTLSGTEIKLDWLAPVSGDPPTDYVLQQRHVGFGGFVTLATIPAPSLTYTSTGLVSGDTYDYRVRADNGAGSSPYSNIATNATFTVPGAPLNLIANTINDTAIFLDWDVPSFTNGGIIKYEIERESPENGGFSKIAEIATTTESNFTSTAYKVETNNFAGSTCPTNRIGPSTLSGEMRASPSNSVLDCERQAFEFDISSIPTGAIVTNATIEYDVTLVAGGPPRTCDFNDIQFQPSAYPVNFTGASNLWDDIGNGTSFIAGNTDCQTIANDYIRVLPASAIADIQDNIDGAEGWWAFGGKLSSEVRVSSQTHRADTGTFLLTLEIINATTSPDTEYTDTGLTPKTEYNYRVNATNLIGSGPYSNEAKDTTFGVAGPPINLAFDTNGVSTITVEWDEPVNNFGSAVTGYRIDQAQDVGGTFVTVIGNTGNNVEPLEETFIGLLQQTTYIYRIAAINGFGLGDFSANLTAGTFIGPSEPENFFAQFNATKPYSVFLSWETPLSDGGKPIQGYLVERKNESGVFVLIANLTSPLLLNYTDDSLLQLIEHEYRVAAYSNPIGSFTSGSTATVVPPNFTSFVINDFNVVGDVLGQAYTIEINDCFPACVLTSADIERNGIVEANYLVGQPLPLDTPLNFTTFFIIPVAGSHDINTTAIVTNPGTTGDDEVGVITTSFEFQVDTIFFNHSRNTAFDELNFELVRHPIPWNAECELRGGRPAVIDTVIPVLPFGGTITLPGSIAINPFDITATLSLQGVGSYESPPTFDVVPSRNAYMACFDPEDIQILAFTSFGTGNGTLALTGFTDQLGTFLGVPVPFIFIIILAAIWTGRSASTGIIFLAVAIGSLGVLGYFDPLTGSPTVGSSLTYFWGFIIFLTLVGAFLGKRFF